MEFVVSALVTLLVVVDPVGLVPTFIGITHGLPSDARRSVALRASVIAAIVLIGAAVAILLNLAADLLYSFIDPRIRLGGRLA